MDGYILFLTMIVASIIIIYMLKCTMPWIYTVGTLCEALHILKRMLVRCDDAMRSACY